jgi:hypothetical protein
MGTGTRSSTDEGREPTPPEAENPAPVRGRPEIEEAGRRAASNYRDGRAIGFDNFANA